MHGINDGVAVVGSRLPSARGPTPVRQTPVVGDSKEPGPDRGLLLEAGERLIRRQKDLLGDLDRKSTRLNSSHATLSRMPSSA